MTNQMIPLRKKKKVNKLNESRRAWMRIATPVSRGRGSNQMYYHRDDAGTMQSESVDEISLMGPNHSIWLFTSETSVTKPRLYGISGLLRNWGEGNTVKVECNDGPRHNDASVTTTLFLFQIVILMALMGNLIPENCFAWNRGWRRTYEGKSIVKL